MANGENKKLIGTIAASVASALVANSAVPVNRFDEPVVAQVVEQVVKSDPVLKNELNQESPVQSRVGWGGTIATLGAAGASFLQFAVLMGYITPDDSVRITGAVSALAGAIGGIYALYGRFAPGLKPLFSKK